jgi:hypothetical protein
MLNILPAEISNPGKNLREIIKRIGLRFTKLYYLNDIVFFSMHVFCLSFWIPPVYYWMVTCETTHPILLILYPIHVYRGFPFVVEMSGLLLTRFRELKKLKAAKVEL